MDIKHGLTFDDVLLEPKKSYVKSRKDIDVSTLLSRNIKLNIPIVSANMDAVTEAKMAIAMARLGGIGIIHRYMNIEEEVEEIKKVKRAESVFIENPYTLTIDKKLRDANELMSKHGVTGILIVNENNKLKGILSLRDTLFENDEDKNISDLMSKDLVTSKLGTTLEEAREILRKNKIEKLPIVDKDNNLKGLITSSDIVKREKFPNACKDKKGRLRVGAAIGVKPGFLERAEKLINADVDVLVVDIAHGHSELAINTIKEVKKNFDVELIAGNVATIEGTKELIKAGADAVKIGVGGGSTCITRIVTGAGVPQLTTIMECCKDAGSPIIADQGIRSSGDITKALAAGANSVMIGGLLAGTEESPGISIIRNGRKYKVSRGMASLGARFNKIKEEEVEEYVPEGVEALVPYRGNVKEVINQLIGGLRSGISYGGADNIKDLQKNAKFIKISKAGLVESKDHDVERI